MSDKTVKLLSTFFYVGYIPFAPGSCASVVGVLIYIVLYRLPVFYVLLGVAITVIGFFVSGAMEAVTGKKDPSCIVIDEVAGVMIAFFMLPLNWPVIWTAYFLFRALDMFKIYPVNKFEEIKGSTGIMMDDLFAGFYTNIIMHVAIRWAGIM